MTQSQYKEGILMLGTLNGLIAAAEHDLFTAVGPDGIDFGIAGRAGALRAIREYLKELLQTQEALYANTLMYPEGRKPEEA